MAAMDDASRPAGRNSISGQQLLSFLERIERVREEKKQLAEDEKLIFAEANAMGFHPATMRTVLKRRAARPADLEEAEAQLDMYLHAVGMAKEAPLFRAVGMMNVDIAMREQVIEGLKQLVPAQGEIILKVGSQPVRLWRDDRGVAQVEDYHEKPVPSARPGTGSSMPPRHEREVPDVDEAGAFALGQQAYHANQPITSNPFPWNDKRRPQFDAGWRDASGSDGMGPET
ncbi:MAG: DUF2312 domain-containing protein [Shinella sp.]|nr:DUF2312 domain-containing protein [Shinella sp.]